jgi:hypothetical protein
MIVKKGRAGYKKYLQEGMTADAGVRSGGKIVEAGDNHGGRRAARV